MMERNLVLTNFKNYPQSTLESASELLSSFRNVSAPADIDLVFSLSPLDLCLAREFTDLSIFSQHVDMEGPGASTGMITVEGLKGLGILGSLLNHSEHRVAESRIRETLKRADDTGFTVILCVEDAEEAAKYAELAPSYIAYEPPELIGGDISVSTSRPEIIGEVVSICGRYDVPVLVGAGVKNRGDFTRSLELGARGVLIASGIVKSPDPVGSLTSLISSE